MTQRVYRYKKTAADSLLMCILLFGGMGAWSLWQALYGTTGINNALMHLTPGEATLFEWGGVVFSVIAIGFTLVMFLLSSSSPVRSLTLCPDKLIAPAGIFSKKTIDVPYTSIRQIKISVLDPPSVVTLSNANNRRVRTLIILHSQGETRIPDVLLEDKSSFEEICALVQQAIGGR